MDMLLEWTKVIFLVHLDLFYWLISLTQFIIVVRKKFVCVFKLLIFIDDYLSSKDVASKWGRWLDFISHECSRSQPHLIIVFVLVLWNIVRILQAICGQYHFHLNEFASLKNGKALSYLVDYYTESCPSDVFFLQVYISLYFPVFADTGWTFCFGFWSKGFFLSRILKYMKSPSLSQIRGT